jgi:hypothetical protein
MRRVAWIIALLLLAGPLAAQYDDDEQTRDYEEQDRLYHERYLEQQEEQDKQNVDEAAQTTAEDQLQAFLVQADALIRDRNYNGTTSAHYRVQTDDPRVNPQAAADLLERFRDYFAEFWSDRTELKPYDDQNRVFLFYSFYRFNELINGNFTFRLNRPQGHYGAWYNVITLHTDPDNPGNLAETLVHEGAHQLVTQQIYVHGQLPSLWVSEGLATYFGHTYMDADGRFHAGTIGGKATTVVRGEKPGQDDTGEWRLKLLKQGLRGAGSADVALSEQLVSIRSPDQFYGENALLYYAASWALVHFLLHGDDGAHAEAFVDYLELEAQGRGGASVFYDTLDLSAEELETAFVRHAKRLKSR